MEYDFNKLEICAKKHVIEKRYQDALRIYLFMASGDPSLDGGYLAERIALCYERLNDRYSAKFWYGRAIEENPVVYARCQNAIENLGNVSIDDIV